MVGTSINQTSETSSDSIATDNVKAKTEIIVASSKAEFSIIVKIEIIVATKIELSSNVEANTYNQASSFERIDKKRKRYKTISSFETHVYFSQSTSTLFLQSSKKRFRLSFENLQQFNWNVSIDQLSSINLISRIKVIRYLYVRHFEAEFSDIVHEVAQIIIDHSRESDEKNTENYEYQFSSFRFVELSSIGSLSSF